MNWVNVKMPLLLQSGGGMVGFYFSFAMECNRMDLMNVYLGLS